VSTRAATVLERILAETRAEVERRKREAPLAMASPGTERSAEGERTDADGERTGTGSGRFHDALARPGIGVIAEFKRRSPSAGPLREDPDLGEIVGAYERGGAVAVSVLTEGPNFGGALEDLRAARDACELPLLRKDFIVDDYQLHEARAAGADAVLLIVAALGDDELASLYSSATAIGLDVLVEVHDREELQRALGLGAEIIGINNRDLRDFSVDVERTARLMADVPAGIMVVSESGIGTAAQLARLGERGVSAALIGESLMRAADPAATLRALNSLIQAEKTL
jgi:indole-3-glycerol phosphate synthase